MKELLRRNGNLVERLNEAIEKDAVFHASIILSRNPADRESFAKDYVKGILSHRPLGDEGDGICCRKVDGEKHEDLIVLRKKTASISIQDVRSMQKRIQIKPLGERYVVLIPDGDFMQEVAQNALLKTLEEPPGDTVILLLAEDIENLLPTVRSRCVVYSLEEAEEGDDEETRILAEEIMTMAAEGAPYYSLSKTAAALTGDREQVREFLDRAEEICRDRLFSRDGKGMPYNREDVDRQIHAIENARRKLERGLSVRYTIIELLLRIGG